MKKLIVSAALAGLATAFSLPALACPGAEQPEMASVVDQKNVELTGVVTQEGCPAEAQEMACTGYVLTTDKDNGKFMISKSDVSDKMLTQVKNKARVKVKGDVVAKHGKAMVTVRTFKVGGNA